MLFYILAAIIILPFGFGIALQILSGSLLKSNSIGNSSGEIKDFSKKGLNIMHRKDRVSRNTVLPEIKAPQEVQRKAGR